MKLDAKTLDKYFPASAYVRPGLIQSLLLILVIYIVAAVVIHLILGIFGSFVIIRIIRWLIDLYIILGIIYAVCKYFRIIK